MRAPNASRSRQTDLRIQNQINVVQMSRTTTIIDDSGLHEPKLDSVAPVTMSRSPATTICEADR
jgi:hypothetical protein